MNKTLFAIIFPIICFTAVFSQNTEKSANNQINYSESTPYQPRQFENKKSKSKKENKSKSNVSVDNKNQFANASIIKIPIFVFDVNGKPATDIKTSEVKLFIDEKEQGILSFEAVNQPLNLKVVLDTSPSTAYQPEDIQNFARKFIDSLGADYKVQLIKFNQEVKILTESTNDYQILDKAIKKIQMGNGTALYDSVKSIFQKQINNSDVTETIILLTDGVDTTSLKANYISSLVEAEKKTSVVFPFYFDTFDNQQKTVKTPFSNILTQLGKTVSISSKEDYELGKLYLQDLASLSGGRMFSTKNLSGLKKENFSGMLKLLKPQYLLSFNTTELEKSNARKQIKIRVMRPKMIVQARGSFFIE